MLGIMLAERTKNSQFLPTRPPRYCTGLLASACASKRERERNALPVDNRAFSHTLGRKQS